MIENNIYEFLFYSATAIIIVAVLFFYLKFERKKDREILSKIEKAKEIGTYEPVSLHPVINSDICIGTGACVDACPEKDILGLLNCKGVTINASRCVGHGACFHACPVEAISLVMGTEKRGVELPHISPEFETNIPMMFIAGELGGMGLIKNAVEQGKQAIDNIVKKLKNRDFIDYDVIIVGAGPAGISATLNSKYYGLKYLTLEQDTIGGTVYSFPRQKIIMTSPMNLPLYGKIKLTETKKSELLSLWNNVIDKHKIRINENEKVIDIKKEDDLFTVITNNKKYTTSSVLLTIGRRGSPRKLNVPGEEKEKVFYRLLDPELINNKEILVVGGGDSAIEAAIMLTEQGNNVTISYRSQKFSRLKEQNFIKINQAIIDKKIKVFYNSNVEKIFDDYVELSINENEIIKLKNDLVYIFIGGELPNQFLEKIGIKITKKFGDVILSHKK
ncbi:MAG: NAD(P)-binding domain-containing protein [Candidatus Woesearchaeota archaeon]